MFSAAKRLATAKQAMATKLAVKVGWITSLIFFLTVLLIGNRDYHQEKVTVFNEEKASTCECERAIRGAEVDFNRTTCSEDAFAQGEGQKVVSFTFFEGETYDNKFKRDYFKGIR